MSKNTHIEWLIIKQIIIKHVYYTKENYKLDVNYVYTVYNMLL